MLFLGNIIWLALGGVEAALGYVAGSIALAVTIVGIPFGTQHFKMARLALSPFGKKVTF